MRAPLILVAAIVAALLTSTGQAQVQANRTFVSGRGSDGNPCSLAAPCRSFAAAIAQTNAGGEIAVLDTAGYGAVTITKSVSIVAPDGIEAGITVTSGDGITINAGANDVVNLRGLTMTGGGVGNNAITFNSGAALRVQNCVMRGFVNGIIAAPSADSSYTISDTVISDVSNFGVQIAPTGSANASVLVKRAQLLRIVGNANAKAFVLSAANLTQGHFVVGSVSDVSVSDSVVGFETDGPPDLSSATLNIDSSEIVRNQFGFRTNGSSRIEVGNSSIIQNDQMYIGTVCTHSNNRGFGNGGFAFSCFTSSF